MIDVNQEGGIKGIDLLLKIRKHEDLILIFMITGADNKKNKSDTLNLNIAGYLHKPIDSDKSFYFFSILYNYWNIIEYSSEKK